MLRLKEKISLKGLSMQKSLSKERLMSNNICTRPLVQILIQRYFWVWTIIDEESWVGKIAFDYLRVLITVAKMVIHCTPWGQNRWVVVHNFVLCDSCGSWGPVTAAPPEAPAPASALVLACLPTGWSTWTWREILEPPVRSMVSRLRHLGSTDCDTLGLQIATPWVSSSSAATLTAQCLLSIAH